MSFKSSAMEQNLSGQTATGNSQTTAFALANGFFQQFSSVPSGTGVILPVGQLPQTTAVANGDVNTLLVYPPVGGTVNGLSVNSPMSLAAGAQAIFSGTDLLTWFSVSGSSGGGGGGTSPVVITAAVSTSQNNWSPTGWLTAGAQSATVIQGSFSTSAINITGLVPPSSGTVAGSQVIIQVAKTSAYWVRLVANSSSSTAANRFGFLSDVFIDPGESITLEYDSVSALWLEATAHKDYRSDLWGSAKDGNVTATSGTLPRTMYYDVLTIPASVALALAGFDIYCNVLDISGASAGSITGNGGAGGTGAAGGGAGAATASPQSAISSTYLQDGGKLGGAGSSTNGAAATQATGRTCYNPLAGGSSGAGGAGGTGTGGASIAPTASNQAQLPLQLGAPIFFTASTVFTPISSGCQGTGGSGGGGDGTAFGAGGGGGGVAGGAARIFARKINRGTNTTAGIIQAMGGAGGLGGTPIAGSAGGGGGGAGGTGGTVLVYHSGLFGSAITGAIDVSGGSGGNGGTKVGSGAAANGSGGWAGPGGYAQIMDVRTGVITNLIGSPRAANTTQTGGVPASSQLSL